jgi:hypothetical protein
MGRQGHSSLVTLSATAIFLLAWVSLGCAPTKKVVIDKREQNSFVDNNDTNPDEDPAGGADGEVAGPGDDNTVVDDTVLNFSGLAFQLAARSDQLDQAYRDNLLMASKVAEGTNILFGKDGTSWIYGQEGSDQPEEVLPAIAPPEERQLLTMDQGDFWIVGPERVSKRKMGPDMAENQIVLHNFDLTKLSGDASQLRILGATHTTLILSLGTHLAIFTVWDGLTSAYELEAKLPAGIEGDVIAAGDTTDGGFWLATADRFALLKQVELQWHWNIADIPMDLADYTSLALRIDVEGQRPVGDSVAVKEDVYSVSGAPIAAAP